MRLPLVVAVVAAIVPGGARAGGIGGTWEGTYVCAQGTTALALTVDAADAPAVTAFFHFHAVAENPLVPEGCYEMSGTFRSDARTVSLTAGRWLLQPYGYFTVDLKGRIDADGAAMRGTVKGLNCTTFELRHVGGEQDLPKSCRAPAIVSLN